MHKQRDARLSIIILQEILQSYPFLMSRNFETQCSQWHEVKRIKSIFADEGNSETEFKAPLYYLY